MSAQQKKEKIWTKDFVLICLANFFIFLGFQMTLPTIPLFVQQLGGSDQFIGLITGIFTFSALLLRPTAGHSLETKGRQFVYMIGLGIFVVSIGSYAFITSIVVLFMMRIVQGLGWGFSTTATGTIATDLIPESRRGEGMGYFGLSGNIALAAGPVLGLTLYKHISFTLLFLICAALGIIAFLLSSQISYKPVDPEARKVVPPRFDVMEKSALRPSLLLFFITFCFGGIASFLPLYTDQEGIAGIEAYFLIYAIFLMITRAFAGQLYDRKGHIAVFIPGAFLIFVAMFLLTWLPNSMVLYIAAALYGLGFGTVQPALQAWAVNQSPENRKGMANATFFSFFDLGVGIGAIGFGFIASAFGYMYIYAAGAVSVVISIILYILLLLKDRKIKQHELV
ncbi:Predicted arabinose efflux permease, MFS family [Gracilibacillus ureilyticus]|uniref:Predicted arabinose efflux permease, MFS family n=1 Tax=Gracilibacillus ureilyticus TaxID=531814 RepID=A0A1H9S9E6_9BACI|nr:MFS transporter [Gracilibacillus ureilyticus]SER81630.1 Predicted arabinose efflux permease, MFS family [Gracilibacillus ureilyticus]